MDYWFVIIDREGLFHTVKFNTRFEALNYVKELHEEGQIKGQEKLYIASGEEIAAFKVI